MSVTLHEGTTFLVSDERGDVEPQGDGGLFQLDTRFLSRHALRLDGERPVLLQASVLHAGEACHFLTNPPLQGARRSTLGLTLRRTLDDGLREVIEVENFAGGPARLQLSIAFDVDFEYVLTVKKRAAGGGDGDWTPSVQRSVQGGREVVLSLEEGGEPHRLSLRFEPAPDQLTDREARWDLALAPRQRWRAELRAAASVGDPAAAHPARRHPDAARRRREAIGAAMPRVRSDHPVLARACDQAARDLAALRIKAEGTAGEDGGGGAYAIAAGIPWYMDLFGRDSLIASYQSLLHDPALARGTLDGLARLQGRKVDRVSEEAPGKILHEYRRGPLTPAARKLIPAYPYYGTIDATPLFLVTLHAYAQATGDLDHARRLWPQVRAALEWMRRYGDRDGDGFLEYQRDTDVGLVNQGWKDSTDSVRFRDGRIAAPPIALVEVQGYAVDARRRTADLARRLGEGAEAERLEEEAAALQRRIHERYWLADRSFFAEALDGEKAPVDALTSNPGHLLWSGAVSREDAAAIARVLLGDDLFSGFGIRTMGEREGGYNPVSYHDGSVWPHDNALILEGLVRHGLRDEATRLANALLTALGGFPDAAPPELFCGYPSADTSVPVRYPTACRPQAWASGAVLLLLRSVLGLTVDALEREVAVAPLPIAGLSWLEVEGLHAGGARIDVTVVIEDGRATSEVKGLPPGWRRAGPQAPAAAPGT